MLLFAGTLHRGEHELRTLTRARCRHEHMDQSLGEAIHTTSFVVYPLFIVASLAVMVIHCCILFEQKVSSEGLLGGGG